jgi:hypothetical protein
MPAPDIIPYGASAWKRRGEDDAHGEGTSGAPEASCPPFVLKNEQLCIVMFLAFIVFHFFWYIITWLEF